MADEEDRPFEGLSLYACTLSAVRPSETPGAVEVRCTSALQAALTPAAAEERMLGDYGELYPVVDGWDVRTRAQELDQGLIIEFAAEYAARLGIRVRRQNVR